MDCLYRNYADSKYMYGITKQCIVSWVQLQFSNLGINNKKNQIHSRRLKKFKKVLK